MYQYPDYLIHYGIKGMRWGHRKAPESTGVSSSPQTQWGRNRAYVKEQDRLNKQMWKDTKSRVESGQLSKKSAEYKSEKNRYKVYNRTRKQYSINYGMTKAARGKIMLKNKISAKTPAGEVETSTQLKNDVIAMAKQTAKWTLASSALTAAATVGARYVNRQL